MLCLFDILRIGISLRTLESGRILLSIYGLDRLVCWSGTETNTSFCSVTRINFEVDIRYLGDSRVSSIVSSEPRREELPPYNTCSTISHDLKERKPGVRGVMLGQSVNTNH